MSKPKNKKKKAKKTVNKYSDAAFRKQGYIIRKPERGLGAIKEPELSLYAKFLTYVLGYYE